MYLDTKGFAVMLTTAGLNNNVVVLPKPMGSLSIDAGLSAMKLGCTQKVGIQRYIMQFSALEWIVPVPYKSEKKPQFEANFLC